MPNASVRFSASALIEAPAGVLYAIIADYRQGHPRILPSPPFTGITVEEGGYGAGTVMVVGMRVLGREQPFRSVVSEPHPGRVLVETNDTGYVTTFSVEPQGDGRHTRVTFSTELPRKPGLAAALERWFTPRFMRPVYVRELKQLADVAGALSIRDLESR